MPSELAGAGQGLLLAGLSKSTSIALPSGFATPVFAAMVWFAGVVVASALRLCLPG